jgi:hypothetical protein
MSLDVYVATSVFAIIALIFWKPHEYSKLEIEQMSKEKGLDISNVQNDIVQPQLFKNCVVGILIGIMVASLIDILTGRIYPRGRTHELVLFSTAMIMLFLIISFPLLLNAAYDKPYIAFKPTETQRKEHNIATDVNIAYYNIRTDVVHQSKGNDSERNWGLGLLFFAVVFISVGFISAKQLHDRAVQYERSVAPNVIRSKSSI